MLYERKSGVKAICSSFVLLAAAVTSGCAESNWQMPCKLGEPHSKMWSSDPRTKS